MIRALLQRSIGTTDDEIAVVQTRVLQHIRHVRQTRGHELNADALRLLAHAQFATWIDVCDGVLCDGETAARADAFVRGRR